MQHEKTMTVKLNCNAMGDRGEGCAGVYSTVVKGRIQGETSDQIRDQITAEPAATLLDWIESTQHNSCFLYNNQLNLELCFVSAICTFVKPSANPCP